jgi:hypothetical protein
MVKLLIIGKKLISYLKNKIKKFLITKKSPFFYGKFLGGSPKIGFIYFSFLIRKLKVIKLFLSYHSNTLMRYIGISKAEKISISSPLNTFENKIFKQLKNEGIVKLDEYFVDIVDQLLKENERKLIPKNSYYLDLELELSDAFYKILNEKSLKKIASYYYDSKAYFRYRPHLYNTFPKRNDITSRERFESNLQIKDLYDGEPIFADEWHLDSVYNLQYHILLNDNSTQDTRMLFAKSKPCRLIEGPLASEEYVLNNYQIFELVSKKGTVFLFDGSIHWHRLLPVANSLRQTISVLFSKGQNIYSSDNYENKLEIDKLDEASASYVKYL